MKALRMALILLTVVLLTVGVMEVRSRRAVSAVERRLGQQCLILEDVIEDLRAGRTP